MPPGTQRLLVSGLLACCAATFSFAEAPELRSPTRLAITAEGEIVVTDYRRASVIVMTPTDLDVRHRLDIRGKPLSVAAAGGRLYVGNDSRGAIEVYPLRRGGIWKRSARRRAGVACDGTAFDVGAVPQPLDIAIDSVDDRMYVVSGGRKVVAVYDLKGCPLFELGGPGSVGDLSQPTGIAVDETAREVYVSDYGDPALGVPASVQIYDMEGNHQAEISGDSGRVGFEFSRPQGLAVDGTGQVFLVDSLLGQVLVFDRQSLQGVSSVGSYGSEPGQLMLPLDVVIDTSTWDLLVANNRLGRIEVFAEGALLP